MSTSSYDAAGQANGRASDGYDSEAFERGNEPRWDARDNGSTATLLRRLGNDVAVLFRKELALAASEVGESVDEAKNGITSMVSGGAVLYLGVLFLLGAIAAWLATLMPAWAAALIVGAVTTIVGLIMLFAGKKKVQARSFAPERTVDSLRKDKDAIRRQMS